MDISVVVLCVCYVVSFLVLLCILYHVYFGTINTFKHAMSSLDHVDDEVDKLSASMAECVEEVHTHIKLKNADKQPTSIEPD